LALLMALSPLAMSADTGRRGRWLQSESMIPKSGYRFSEKIMLHE
jgi:hypothetical protein